jgi:predicted alpha/beta superfamily hydrolase
MHLVSRTSSMLAHVVVLAFASCLTGCGGGGGGGAGAPSAASDAFTRTLTVTSAYTGVTYPVTIYLPAGYATSSDAKAVIYGMDDELEAKAITDAVIGMNIDAIVVSIGNLGGDRRFVDFDLPGATAYFRFLTLELIPRVEAEYRVDKSRRTLMGYSLSGLAAMIALLEDGPSARYFSGYVMTDPSMQFHTQELLGMEQTLWDTTHNLPVTVHHCTTDTGSPWVDLEERMQSRGYQGLRYQFRYYPVSHGAVLVLCVNDGLRWVFGLH